MAFIRANTNAIGLLGLRDRRTSAFVPDAVITATVYDTNSIEVYESGGAVPISGASGLSMGYQSNGDYWAILPQTVQLTADTDVLVVLQSSNYGIFLTDVVTVQKG